MLQRHDALAGNESDFRTVALGLGVGPRFYFGDSGFSVLPAFTGPAIAKQLEYVRKAL